MKKTALVSLVSVLLVALTACGGSDDKKKEASGPSRSEVVAAFAKEFSSTQTGALDKKEADCFASDFVEKAGVDRLRAAKIVNAKGEVSQENAEFDEELATQYAEAFLGCVDFTAKQASVIAAADKKVDEKKLAECLDKALPDDFVTRFIVSSYLESKDVEALRAQSAAKLEKCRDSAAAK